MVNGLECKWCGNYHSIYTVCINNPTYTASIKPATWLESQHIEEESLFGLYAELGTSKWNGSDEWNKAIEAVKVCIRKRLE